MVDNIQKALNKVTVQEKERLQRILTDIARGYFGDYDVKKLKGRNDIYRIRKGKMRIIYRIDKGGEVFLVALERRSDNTYNF